MSETSTKVLLWSSALTDTMSSSVFQKAFACLLFHHHPLTKPSSQRLTVISLWNCDLHARMWQLLGHQKIMLALLLSVDKGQFVANGVKIMPETIHTDYRNHSVSILASNITALHHDAVLLTMWRYLLMTFTFDYLLTALLIMNIAHQYSHSLTYWTMILNYLSAK